VPLAAAINFAKKALISPRLARFGIAIRHLYFAGGPNIAEPRQLGGYCPNKSAVGYQIGTTNPLFFGDFRLYCVATSKVCPVLWPGFLFGRLSALEFPGFERDPEKWVPVFRRDRAPAIVRH
jgi:hypothetical protein